MHVQDLKRWHWALIAIVIGLALSYVWANVEWGVQLPTIGQPDFERGIVAKYPQPGHLDNLVVLPPLEGKHKVVCEQLRPTSNPRVMEFRPVVFMADSPFKAFSTGQPYPSIRDYLKSVKQETNQSLSFSYAWYRENWAIYLFWTSACLLLIGGVWPSVVSLMTGGGLGLKPAPKTEPEYDLSRFGKGHREPSRPVAAPAPTDADMDELRRLDEELEKRLASGATLGGGAAAAAAPGDENIRKLDGGPLEESQVQQDELEKEYGGEFYPVVRAIHKKPKEGEEHQQQAH